MQKNQINHFSKGIQKYMCGSDRLVLLAVDASNSMLLQRAPFGRWSRLEMTTYLISHQLFNLFKSDKAHEKTLFIVIGYNSQNAIITPLNKQLTLQFFSSSNQLWNYLSIELKKLGGEQNTNKGFKQVKKIHDELLFVTPPIIFDTNHQYKTKSKISLKDSKFIFFTDAEDAVTADIINPFHGKQKNNFITVFVGEKQSDPGYIALRYILSKCSIHKKNKLFHIDKISTLGKMETGSFLDFTENNKQIFCPICLDEKLKASSTLNNDLNIIVSEPKRMNKTDQKIRKKISGEIIMTSGPRKDDDVALGEDAGGLVLEQNLAAFWVADGTSESPVVMDFSSRSMAQGLGTHFIDEITKISETELIENIKKDEMFIAKVLDYAFKSLLKTWSLTLDDLLRAEDKKKALDKKFEYDAEKKRLTSESHYPFQDFSTTFIGGLVTNRGTGVAACIGDTPFCVYGKGGFDIYDFGKDRIFARLRKLSNTYKFDNASILKDIGVKKFSEAKLVIAGSDGIGGLPQFLSAQIKSFTWPEVRKRIHRYLPRTEDDKTLCVIHIGE